MGLFKKVKAAVAPKDVTLQLAQTKKKLMALEEKFEVIMLKERNVINTAKTKSARKSAEERMRNAYISLRLVHIAQERLYDAQSTYDLKNAITELGKSMAVINRIGKKNGRTSPALFLNLRARGMLDGVKNAEEGGMKAYYDTSVDEILVSDDVMSKLTDMNIPLDYVVEKEEATMEQMEKFVDMLNDEDGLDGLDLDFDIKDLDLEDGLDDLISNLD